MLAGARRAVTVTLPHPEERKIWLAAARALEPRPRIRPSEWAAENVRLTSVQSARPGPYDPDWKPWLRDLLDLPFLEPAKKGVIGVKPGQVGWSVATTILLVWAAAAEPGPFLYVTTDREKAKAYCETYFAEFVKGSPSIRPLFDVDDDRSELKFHKPFKGGFVDFFGGGSEAGVISFGRRIVVLDEYQLAADMFRKTAGDLWQTALVRLETYRDVSRLLAFSHPKFAGQDIDELWQQVSDRRRWVFDCPHCGGTVEPAWRCVEFAAVDADARRRAESARLLCPHCRRPITDAERARATWPPRKGGTGRFESELTPEEASRRDYIGLKLAKLADPDVALIELARRFVACVSEEQLLTFANKTLGEPREETKAVVTAETVAAVMDARETILLPGGDLGVRYLVVGADVQAPRQHPTLYAAGVGFAASGWAFVVALERCSGWAAFFDFLRRLRADVEGRGPIGASLAVVDAGWETGQVIENCRVPTIYAAADSRIIERLPVRYVPHLHADNPQILAPESKRRHPTRPELGLIDYHWLHRHSWVDRTLRRIVEGRVKVLCRAPEEFASHLMSNLLRPAPKRHGMEQLRDEWWKPDEVRDDWLQALVYAEAGAAIRLGLDSLHATATAEPPPPEPAGDAEPGFGRGGFGRGRFH